MATATIHGSYQFPALASDIPPTTQADMGTFVQTLQEHKDAWVAVSVRERVALLDRLIADCAALAERWVAASIQGKRIPAGSPAASEEWLTGPYVTIKCLRQLRQSLLDVEATGRPRIPGPVTTRPDGQVVAQVFPVTGYDKVFFSGVKAEIWMEPGVIAADLPKTQAVIYQDRQHAGKVALVLGAGNVSSIGPTDILYKLLMEDQVVIFKSNPVNAYIGPIIEEAFKALIEAGYLRIVYGGAAEGAYLCNHAGVDEVHITGSDKTFEAIVFGPGPEGAKRKAERKPLLNKRVTGELGNVSPVIVVPGPWTARDLAYQGDHIASMLTNNAGFNCNATRVIIQHAGWNQRQDLLQAVRKVLAGVPPRAAYYPGAHDRQKAFVAAHPEAEQIGTPSGDELPWTLIAGVDPTKEEDIVFTTEAFCSLFAESALEAASVAEYLDRAVEFANQQLWGTLNATILVHPASLKDPAVAAALDRAIANLRYGTVAVNYWAAAGFAMGAPTWGGFPGNDVYDVQSGIGIVHNTLLFDRPQKTVLRAPFRSMPVPAWFVTQSKTALKVYPKLTAFEANPSFGKLPAILWTAMAG
ncbi:MAG TPA: aldehyde dehydrogenase family protein [Ktedonobacterales bacterium]|nr:aldehyde dehydrogenase family protein [Ktedonobacterales bacterium]